MSVGGGHLGSHSRQEGHFGDSVQMLEGLEFSDHQFGFSLRGLGNDSKFLGRGMTKWRSLLGRMICGEQMEHRGGGVGGRQVCKAQREMTGSSPWPTQAQPYSHPGLSLVGEPAMPGGGIGIVVTVHTRAASSLQAILEIQGLGLPTVTPEWNLPPSQCISTIPSLSWPLIGNLPQSCSPALPGPQAMESFTPLAGRIGGWHWLSCPVLQNQASELVTQQDTVVVEGTQKGDTESWWGSPADGEIFPGRTSLSQGRGYWGLGSEPVVLRMACLGSSSSSPLSSSMALDPFVAQFPCLLIEGFSKNNPQVIGASVRVWPGVSTHCRSAMAVGIQETTHRKGRGMNLCV
jgi:hypothetical protein